MTSWPTCARGSRVWSGATPGKPRTDDIRVSDVCSIWCRVYRVVRAGIWSLAGGVQGLVHCSPCSKKVYRLKGLRFGVLGLWERGSSGWSGPILSYSSNPRFALCGSSRVLFVEGSMTPSSGATLARWRRLSEKGQQQRPISTCWMAVS